MLLRQYSVNLHLLVEFTLCMALPKILDDILEAEPTIVTTYEVYNELDKKDFLKSLYKLAFSTYEGFEIL